MQVLDLRVLVVENDPDAADVVAMVVEGLGCQCVVAHTCATAGVLAATFAPNVVIVDEHLEDGSGFQLATSLRRGRAMYIISFSGTGATAHGIDEALVKPASPALLRECMFRAVACLGRAATE